MEVLFLFFGFFKFQKAFDKCIVSEAKGKEFCKYAVTGASSNCFPRFFVFLVFKLILCISKINVNFSLHTVSINQRKFGILT